MATDVSYFNTMNALASGGGGLPFDLSKGSCLSSSSLAWYQTR